MIQNCEICGSELINKIGEINAYPILRCENCSVSYTSRKPTVKELESIYKSAKIDKWKKGKPLQDIYEEFRNNASSKKDYYGHAINVAIEKTGRKKLKILEVGTAKGLFVDYAIQMGHEACGTEVSIDVVELVNSNFPGRAIYLGNKTYAEYFEEGSFDLIYAEHVFEHLPNPNQMISVFQKILKRGGVFFLAVPNHESFSAKKQGIKYFNITPPIHLFYYTEQSLSKLLEKHGLKIVHTRILDTYHTTIWQFYSLDRFLNTCIAYTNRITGLRIRNLSTRASYPSGFFDHFRLLPYWFHLLWIKLFGFKKSMEELNIAAIKH